MLILQQNHLVYIGEEVGRWPSREDYLLTHSISLTTNNSFQLFIPIRQIDRFGIRDDNPLSPFSNPIPLVQIVRDYYRLKPRFYPSLPYKVDTQDSLAV